MGRREIFFLFREIFLQYSIAKATFLNCVNNIILLKRTFFHHFAHVSYVNIYSYILIYTHYAYILEYIMYISKNVFIFMYT